MQTIQIQGTLRTDFGKKSAKAARRQQAIPCALYGGKDQTVHFTVDQKEIKPVLYTPKSYLVAIVIDGKEELAVLRDVQFHPVKDYPQHIDFFRVIDGKPVSIDIPLNITGHSVGVKAGGKLLVQRRKIRISALQENLPDQLDIDITDLTIGKAIFAGDLKYDNITVLTPASTSICTVVVTRASREAEGAAAE